MSFLSSDQLCGHPFISRRESIAWIPSTPAFEDSDVLVLSSRLTSPGGVGAILLYLDLRLSLPLGRASKVDWAFAGLRHTLSTTPARYRWDHNTIDSRDGGVFDEGEVIQRDGTEIESGIGLNPATGQMEPYEEIWRDEPLPGGFPYIFVSSSAHIEEATATMAVLGPHALALARGPEVPREMRVVRMHRRPGQDWEIIFSTGSSTQEQELKELVTKLADPDQYARGDSVYLGSKPWAVWDAGRED